MWSVLCGCPQPVHRKVLLSIDDFLSRSSKDGAMRKKWGILLLAGMATAPVRALPPSDYFTPPETMYAFADFWFVRPLDLAVLPITSLTWVASLPVTAASGTQEQSYNLLVKDMAQHMMARPLGSYFDWENRDQSRPVVIKFKDSYAMAELSPQEERKYRNALKQHEARVEAIERETSLPEKDREELVNAEERRWENVVRVLLSL